MENGSICTWSLDEINKEFIDMTATCWYWNGCKKDDKTASNQCCDDTDDSKCYTEILTRWDIQGRVEHFSRYLREY